MSDECCAACCPSPDYPVFQPSPKAQKWRTAMKWIIYGEIAHVICRMILFGMYYGMFQLINVWIDYMAYATMHFCQVLIVGISGGMDLMMLLMYRNKPYMRARIDSSTFTQVLYWYCVAFSCIKMLVAIFTYMNWKAEFRQQHGHTSLCIQPGQRGGGYGGHRRSLFDNDDERGGYSSGGGAYGQQQPRNNFQAFGGTGVSLGGGAQNQYQQQQPNAYQPYGGYNQPHNNAAYGQPCQPYQQPPAPPQYGQPVMNSDNLQYEQPPDNRQNQQFPPNAQPYSQSGPQNATHNNYWRNRGNSTKLN